MLCILKKNGKLRTVFNLRMQNENTEKDVSPFPDQDTIWHDVARAAYRSKLDMSEAYEQIRVRDEEVPNSVGEVWSSPVISPRLWLKYLMQMMIKKIRVFFGSFSSIPAFCLYTVPGIKVINQYYKK